MDNKKRWKWIIGIGILALLVFLIFSLNSRKTIEGSTIEVREGNISTYYNFAGSVELKNKITIYGETPLQISEFFVEEGDFVEKGDLLYRDSSGQDLEANIKGEVAKILVDEDEQISPGREIMVIADYDDLELKVRVDEYDLNSIEVGKEVEITINALDRTFDGEIAQIAREGIYMNGLTFFDTIISIEDGEGIRVGMSAELRVLNEESKNTALLPMEAIYFSRDNSPYVNVRNDEKIEEVEVKIGITDGVSVEILSGLEIGDEVFILKEESSNFGPPQGVRISENESGGESNE